MTHVKEMVFAAEKLRQLKAAFVIYSWAKSILNSHLSCSRAPVDLIEKNTVLGKCTHYKMMLYDVDVEHPRKTFHVSDYYTLVLCILYLLIGTTSILFNIFNIYVFGRKRSLRKKYIVIIFLEASEIVNGFAYILTGAGRLSAIAYGSLRSQISVEDCFFTKPWPAFIIIGTQLPALVVIFGSIERTIAVHQPSHYYRHWNYSYKLKRLFFLLVIQMLSITLAARSSYGLDNLNPSQHCPIIWSTHIAYCTAHFLFVVLAYVISFVTLMSIFRSRRGYNQVSSSFRRWQGAKRESNLRVFMMTSLMCIVFMSIPALVSLLIRWGVVVGNDFVLGISLVPPGLISIGTTMINCVFHSDYRTHVLRIFCPTKTEKTTAGCIGASEIFPERETMHVHSLILEKDTRLHLTDNSEIML
ncbi:unnamed protein product [Cylicocyclus nassatus]|uniref:G-protein coupled receptors family 1 profile domain-containing protein n=1 Tax=Cylicocyclus nassatus TaxID=53992 RepID=A0AA36GU88_CYLNA|nr:unnamed protein product [Cylicocyclus nassatus]